ncbi:hypothetical protein [Paraburkholderia sp. J41]|uniref:hypothetical protein n=1 Tax=Paraburkholderia sp. J41 TaxID=2805433 RepID=UPI002AC33C8C|nr:hypothetical protein [Paraburkholderia sp. J41]
MKRLYARIVLSLITPAFEEKARRELERWKSDEPRRQAANEEIDRLYANQVIASLEGMGWTLSKDGKLRIIPPASVMERVETAEFEQMVKNLIARECAPGGLLWRYRRQGGGSR